MKLVVAILLIAMVHVAPSESAGEEIVAQCIAREISLSSGHIEFSFHVTDRLGEVFDKDTYYAEWAPDNKVRVGTTQHPDEPILVFDGEVAVTADGTAWPGTVLTDLAVSDEDVEQFTEAEVSQLERAQRLYFGVFHQFLKPFSMGGEIGYDEFRYLYVIEAAEPTEALEGPANTLVRTIPTGNAKNLAPVYAIDSERDLPMARWIEMPGGEPEMDIQWFGAVPLQDELWIPEKMIGNDWTSGNGLVLFMELDTDACWLRSVNDARFSIAAHAQDLSRSGSPRSVEDRVYDALDWMEDHGIITTANVYLAGILLICAGSFWLWRRRKYRSGTRAVESASNDEST
jgi:hypothetical protein